MNNRLLYKEGEHPDHCVVIKYVPYVGDSKRAMDEYTSEIFLGGKVCYHIIVLYLCAQQHHLHSSHDHRNQNTIVMHNTCEDSLLASPIILDLVLICELCERITVCMNLCMLCCEEVWMSSMTICSQVKVADVEGAEFERFHSVLSLLSYLLKAPMVPPGTPVVNALSAQRQVNDGYTVCYTINCA